MRKILAIALTTMLLNACSETSTQNSSINTKNASGTSSSAPYTTKEGESLPKADTASKD